MPTFDTALISRIQQANDIVDVVGEHLSLKRKGREMVGLCPFHDDHRPSLNVNPAKQIFKCFACGAGGDVVKFVQMRENLSFPQALRRLADRAGIKIEPLKPRRSSSESQTASDEVDPNELARVNAWAAKYFAANLANPEKGRSARQYISQRQISDESVKKWQLGLALGSGGDFLSAANHAKIPSRLLLAAGLVVGSGSSLSDKFVNRLMFTITDVTGRVIGFGGRTLAGDDAKYINSPATVLFDKSNALFGLEQARHQITSSDLAVVVEGYTDCIMAHQFGSTNVVATLGTSFTTSHARILRRYAKKVVLLFDSDVAGIEAANRALQVALASRIDIALASVPEGKDPCDFLLAKGKKPFELLIENATNVFQFKWDRLIANLGSQPTIAGKKQAVDEYLDAVATAAFAGNLSAIERGLIVNQLSTIISIDAKDINTELNRRIRRAKTTSAYPDATNKPKSPIDLGEGLSASSQREILEVLLAQPRLFDSVKEKISPQNFGVPALNRIAQAVFQTLRDRPKATVRDICGLLEDTQLAGLALTLEQDGLQKGNFRQRLTDALSSLEHAERQAKKTAVSTDDEREFIRRACEQAPKQNLRNMGMV
jgi:DNA primase